MDWKTEQSMRKAKLAKISTPLSDIKYPLERWEDQDRLLKTRVWEIRDIIKRVMKLDCVALWLLGSHCCGKSASGRPDIDLLVYHPDIVRMGTKKWTEYVVQIFHTSPYALDLSVLPYLVPPRKMVYRNGCVRVNDPEADHLKYTEPYLIKKEKERTPLDPHVQYPCTDWEQTSPLLKARVQVIKEILMEELEVGADTVVWINGSQCHGRSRSGMPDIDFNFYAPSLVKKPYGWYQGKANTILKRVPYAIDFNRHDILPRGFGKLDQMRILIVPSSVGTIVTRS